MHFIPVFSAASVVLIVFAQICMVDSKEYSQIVPMIKRALVQVRVEDLRVNIPYYCVDYPGISYYWKDEGKLKLNYTKGFNKIPEPPTIVANEPPKYYFETSDGDPLYSRLSQMRYEVKDG